MSSSPTSNPATTSASPAWVGEFTALAAIWGSSFLFMRMGAVEFGALATAGARVAIATLFLLPLLAARGQLGAMRPLWKSLLVVGLLNSAIPFACIAYALLAITTGLSSILNATVPLFGAAVAWIWLKDRPHGLRILGLLIGFAGVALLAWDKASFKPDAQGLSTGWAILASLTACLCYGMAASYTRKYLSGVPSLVLATGSQIGATVALAPLAWWFWPTTPLSGRAWLAVTALGVACTGVAYIIYFRLIGRTGPARALAVTFAVPVFAVFYGVVLLGEAVTPWMAGCGVVIVVGTALSTGMITRSPKGK